AAHQGARRRRPSQCRRARRAPGPPAPPHRGDAATHPGQGRRAARGCRAFAGGRRRDLQAGSDGPVARRRRRTLEETPPEGAAGNAEQRACTTEGASPPMTALLELQGVGKTYGEGPTEVHALRDIDLTVEDGELVAVMGPSGSGKS